MTSVPTQYCFRQRFNYFILVLINLYFSTNFLKFLELAGASYEENEVAKAEKYAILRKETIPYYLEKLDSLVKENNGYFALGKVS